MHLFGGSGTASSHLSLVLHSSANLCASESGLPPLRGVNSSRSSSLKVPQRPATLSLKMPSFVSRKRFSAEAREQLRDQPMERKEDKITNVKILGNGTILCH